jgi:hypothetical protein
MREEIVRNIESWQRWKTERWFELVFVLLRHSVNKSSVRISENSTILIFLRYSDSSQHSLIASDRTTSVVSGFLHTCWFLAADVLGRCR